MALPAMIFKAEVNISNMDSHYYQTHNLTLARHPSETNERLMMRLFAFCMNASDNLLFAQGLSSTDEPDLWEKDLQGSITRWIMVGLPDEKQIKKALGRSQQVIIYAYGGSAVTKWREKLTVLRNDNLIVIEVPQTASNALADGAERTMKIQCTIEDGIVWWMQNNQTTEIECRSLSLPR